MNVLPWTLPDPERGSINGAFHCPTCLDTAGEATREGMHCGWIPKERWDPSREGVPSRIGSDTYDVDVCPGWLVRQPEVIEGAEAYSAMESGILDRYDPFNTHVVNQKAMIAKRSFNLFEVEKQKQAQARIRSR